MLYTGPLIPSYLPRGKGRSPSVGGNTGSGRRGRSLEGRVVLRPPLNLSISPPTLLMTLSGLHGRSARLPNPASPTARPHSQGGSTLRVPPVSRAPGSRPSALHRPLITAPPASLPSQQQFTPLSPLLLVGAVTPHPTWHQASSLDPQLPLIHKDGPAPRQLYLAPFIPGIASTPNPAGPNTVKALSAQPSAAPVLPAPQPGVAGSQ